MINSFFNNSLKNSNIFFVSQTNNKKLALKKIHNSNLCHRDIKPENIVFDSKFIIKMIDFGNFISFLFKNYK